MPRCKRLQPLGGAWQGKSLVTSARANIYAVADRAGVSIATVSRVQRGIGPVSAETRERVLRAVDALSYRPDESARSLVRRSTRLVSFHVGEDRHDRVSMLDDFARALARVGEAHGYRLVLDVAGGSDAEQISSFA